MERHLEDFIRNGRARNLESGIDHAWETRPFMGGGGVCVQWLHRPRDISLLLPDTVARRMTGKIGMGNCTVKSSIEEDADQW